MIINYKNKIIDKRPRPAFSLIEVIVATALFSVVIISASSIFKMTIDSQRRAIATQNVQESLKFFLEVISKEIRMAQPDKKLPGCGLPLEKGKIFYSQTDSNGNSRLKFKNYYNECVTYYLDSEEGRFYIMRNNANDLNLPISPSKIKIKSLRFILNASTTAQELVTVNMQAEAVGSDRLSSEMTLQTSLSSRYYK